MNYFFPDCLPHCLLKTLDVAKIMWLSSSQYLKLNNTATWLSNVMRKRGKQTGKHEIVDWRHGRLQIALYFDFSYQERCELTSKLFKDRPSTAMETALYWIEYVIRYNGAPHLRTVGADLPWYQYHLIDVFIVAIILVVFSFYFIFVVSNFIRKIFKQKQQKIKSN